MRRRGLAILLAAGLTLSAPPGCRPAADPLRPRLPPPTAQGLELSPLAPGTKLQQSRQFVILVRVYLIALELPMGSVSDSEELWGYLNEEPLGARIGAALGLNGIRVGLGRDADWPQIRKTLMSLTARKPYTWNFNTPPAKAVSIPLKQTAGTQTIFQFAADRTLSGRDYEPGVNVLTIVPTIDYDNPSAVHISGAAAIRSRPRPQYVETPGGFVLQNRPAVHRLPEMGFRLIVPPGGVVIIAPSQAAYRHTSPGAAFLINTQEGVRFEKVLVIVPEVFYAPVPQHD